jgi:cyclic-di-GMP-binding protein
MDAKGVDRALAWQSNDRRRFIMAAELSFDIVSKFDRQELANAVDQANREISTRYDLKSTGAEISLEKDKLLITADTDFTLKAVREVLIGKMVRRGLDTRITDFGQVEPAARNTVRQSAKLREGIDADLARSVSKTIRDTCPKVRPIIQGDAVRVTGKSKDDLQTAMRTVEAKDWPVPLQFVNYRS